MEEKIFEHEDVNLISCYELYAHLVILNSYNYNSKKVSKVRFGLVGQHKNNVNSVIHNIYVADIFFRMSKSLEMSYISYLLVQKTLTIVI